ncbi:hypothetical protein B484DRAFT_39879 [Ochromonadaceae sp. CCMP2298]|nr:hypothetical protein B484DRAFT_39879 [Ochromonadaceae sp. CCMP2298]
MGFGWPWGGFWRVLGGIAASTHQNSSSRFVIAASLSCRCSESLACTTPIAFTSCSGTSTTWV